MTHASFSDKTFNYPLYLLLHVMDAILDIVVCVSTASISP